MLNHYLLTCKGKPGTMPAGAVMRSPGLPESLSPRLEITDALGRRNGFGRSILRYVPRCDAGYSAVLGANFDGDSPPLIGHCDTHGLSGS